MACKKRKIAAIKIWIKIKFENYCAKHIVSSYIF